MTSDVECVEPTPKLFDIKHIYERRNFHHHFPVTENEKLIGIVSLVDFMRKIHDAGLDDNEVVYQELTVADIMTKNPYSVPSDTTIEEVSKKLAEGDFHAIIISNEGKVDGIVSSKDVIEYFLTES